MLFTIRGLGLAIPVNSLSQEHAADHAVEMWGDTIDRAGAVRTLFRQAGVQRRHSVLLESPHIEKRINQSFYRAAIDRNDHGPSTRDRMERYEREALNLGTRACESAIQRAGIDRDRISHLITVSCSGFSAPGVDVGLIEALNLDRGVARTNVGFMGCHGAFNGLRVAKAFAESDPRSIVLVCCIELCSLHQQYSENAQQIVANALFSDGAAAVVGSAAESIDHEWQLASQSSLILEGIQDLMSWRIGDHGFSMGLSPKVPDVIRVELRPWVEEWLRSVGLNVDQISTWAIHPGGPRILDACSKALGLSDSALDVSRQVLADNGNMSSPTILFILDALRQRGAQLPCVSLAFGPGLTIEAALWLPSSHGNSTGPADQSIGRDPVKLV